MFEQQAPIFLIGQVKLAERSSVWFGIVIRGDNEPIISGANHVQKDAPDDWETGRGGAPSHVAWLHRPRPQRLLAAALHATPR
ncbi:hypothetical protein [Polaromonas sp. OV174]|uniref:hypothetical protein n=1 Tax=Polaromonas sp. OV174 TaxID=1855300 RepID=UPI000B847440